MAFKSLAPNEIESIAKILLKDLGDLLKQNQSIDIEFDQLAVKKIAEWGYDPVFGARPLRKVISDKIRAVLAEKILKNEIKKGGSIKVTVQNDELVFQNV